MLLCGVSLNGIHCCIRLACPCGVLLWSGIGLRELLLHSIMSKRVFKVLWARILKKTFCFQTLCEKDGEALQKFLEFDTRSQHFLSLYSRARIWLFAAKRGLFVHIKPVLLQPTSMAGLLIIASTLLHCAKLLDRHCPQSRWCHHRCIVPYLREEQKFMAM